MSKWNVHNPNGMQDILFDRCFIKRNIENELRSLFRSNGLLEIETPIVEFYDVFSSEDLINQEVMFKFVDEKARLLALRPDLTIPCVRVAGTKLKEMTLPIKMCYIGKCFKNGTVGGGKQREFTQAGVEILGADSSFYDAQIIKMAVEAIQTTGLDNFSIELGQVEFFNGLMDEAGFDKETIQKIQTMIELKDFFGVEEMLLNYDIDNNIKDLLVNLPSLFGDKDMLLNIQSKTKNKRALDGINNLIEILDIVKDYGLSKYVSVDLGMVSNLDYYTGMIIKGITHGVGFPILSGGRYDTLCGKFGKEMAATGFSLGVDMALIALYRNNDNVAKAKIDSLIAFDKEGIKNAIMLSKQLRKQGLSVELREGAPNEEYALQRNINGIIYVMDNESIEVINLLEKTKIKTSMSSLLGGA